VHAIEHLYRLEILYYFLYIYSLLKKCKNVRSSLCINYTASLSFVVKPLRVRVEDVVKLFGEEAARWMDLYKDKHRHTASQ
jgi:hypothetical protein